MTIPFDALYRDPQAPIALRVADLLHRMTPLEKARQLDQYFGTGLLDRTHGRMVTVAAEDARILWDTVEREIGDAGAGCVHDLYSWPDLSNQLQRYAVERTRLGIPILFSEEALHGLVRPGFTVFAQALTLAASWDEKLVRAVGHAIAAETRSIGVCETFGPVIDLARDPRWGRMEETYGEDTHLSARMAVAMVRGLQGERLDADDSIVAEPKHFAAYGHPQGGLNMSACSVGPYELHRDYLPVFEAAFREGGALNAMCSYNSIDGVPCSADATLLTDTLRGQWGMPGFVRSDLGAISRLQTEHQVVATAREAIRAALLAGTDMQYYDYPHDIFQQAIVEMLADGTLPQAALDRAVGRVLTVKFRLGLFERPYADTELYKQRVRCQQHLDIALQSAREGICLLKNDGLLPLRGGKRLAVIGPGADVPGLGDYTPVIEGFQPTTVLQGLRQLAGYGWQITHAKGVNFTEDTLEAIPAAALGDGQGNAGLRGEYFNTPDFSGAPAFTRADAQIDFNWLITKPDERTASQRYSVRWTGVLRSTVTAEGHIGVGTRGDTRLWVDGQLMAAEQATTPFRFEKDREYALRIEYAHGANSIGALLGWSLDESDFQQAVQAAQEADVAIVVMGDSERTCGEGIDRCQLTLPGRQRELLQAVAATGTPVALVLQNGRALALDWESTHVNAIVEAWYGGERAGQAVAEVLLGHVNPSGKLPVSFPKSVGHLPCYYNRPRGGRTAYIEGESNPLYAFGHGLSYTAFEYGNLHLSAPQIGPEDTAELTFTLHNAGAMDGTEVVQMYVRDEVCSMVRPALELKQFRRVTLRAGESAQVTFSVGPKDLQMLTRNLRWVVEPGAFRIGTGAASDDIRLWAELEVR